MLALSRITSSRVVPNPTPVFAIYARGFVQARAKVAAAAAAKAVATKAAQAADAAAAAKGLNDNAHGIDRFGYRVR